MLDKILDVVRIGLFILLGITGLMMYQAWQKDHPAAAESQVVAAANAQLKAERFVPGDSKAAPVPATTTAVATTAAAIVPPTETGKLIKVKTDLLEISIDTVGGDIVESRLLQYPEAMGATAPFTLMTNDSKTRYIAESGLLSADGPDTAQQQAVYSSDKLDYELAPDQKELTVKLHWQKKSA